MLYEEEIFLHIPCQFSCTHCPELSGANALAGLQKDVGTSRSRRQECIKKQYSKGLRIFVGRISVKRIAKCSFEIHRNFHCLEDT